MPWEFTMSSTEINRCTIEGKCVCHLPQASPSAICCKIKRLHQKLSDFLCKRGMKCIILCPQAMQYLNGLQNATILQWFADRKLTPITLNSATALSYLTFFSYSPHSLTFSQSLTFISCKRATSCCWNKLMKPKIQLMVILHQIMLLMLWHFV